MTFAFYLKEPQSTIAPSKQKTTPLVLIISHLGKKFKKQIGISVRPSDFKKQRTHKEKENERLRIIENCLNERLNQFSTEAEVLGAIDYALRMSYGETPAPKKKEGVPLKKKGTPPSFYDYFEEWANRDTPQLKQRRNTLTLIRRLMGESYDWNDIDSAFYFRLMQKMKDEEYSINYMGSVIAKLKTVMSEGYKLKYHRNEEFRQFKKSTERPDTVYLTKEELDKLWRLKPEDEISCKTRDLFLLGCYTAMRFSDYSRLSESNIRNGNIHITQRKTAGSVIIPVSPRVREILKRNGGAAPSMDQVVFNRKIKEVCFAAGITTPIEVTKSKGDRHITETRPKFTQVSSHTARRTGATLLFQTGISVQSLMLITGHKSPQSILSYLRLGKEENAEALKNNPFFK